VGANGSVSNSDSFNIGGALFCSMNATADSLADVRQELHVGANASPLAMTVGDDAYIHGTVAGNPLTIKKTLYHPGGKTGVGGTDGGRDRRPVRDRAASVRLLPQPAAWADRHRAHRQRALRDQQRQRVHQALVHTLLFGHRAEPPRPPVR